VTYLEIAGIGFSFGLLIWRWGYHQGRQHERIRWIRHAVTATEIQEKP
jgi:hypothetical protein